MTRRLERNRSTSSGPFLVNEIIEQLERVAVSYAMERSVVEIKFNESIQRPLSKINVRSLFNSIFRTQASPHSASLNHGAIGSIPLKFQMGSFTNEPDSLLSR